MVIVRSSKVVEIPVDGYPPLLPPLVISREDLTNNSAWEKLNEDRSPYLEVWDFVDYELYEKYWLVSLGILEYSYIFIAGDKGTGKSLFLNWLVHKVTKYFGKKATINWVAKNPALFSPYNSYVAYHLTEKGRHCLLSRDNDLEQYERGVLNYIYKRGGKFTLFELYRLSKEFGFRSEAMTFETIELLENRGLIAKKYSKDKLYHSLRDSDYVNKIQDEMNELADVLALEDREPRREELENLITFNSIFCIDEGSGVAGKGLGTNLVKLLGMLADRQRHLFLCMAISFVKPEDATGRLVLDNATHLVSCSKDVYYRGACSFRIYHKRNDITKMLHLKPTDWTHIWDTHNYVAINTIANVRFGNVKAKELDKKRKQRKEMVEV